MYFSALLPKFSVLSSLAHLHPKSKHFIFLIHWCVEIFSVIFKKLNYRDKTWLF